MVKKKKSESPITNKSSYRFFTRHATLSFMVLSSLLFCITLKYFSLYFSLSSSHFLHYSFLFFSLLVFISLSRYFIKILTSFFSIFISLSLSVFINLIYFFTIFFYCFNVIFYLSIYSTFVPVIRAFT